MAISDKVGVLFVIRDGVDAERFRLFLENLAIILGEENAVDIMDNAPCHRQAETLVTHHSPGQEAGTQFAILERYRKLFRRL